MTEAQQQASFAEVTSLVHPSTKIAVTVRIAEAYIHGGADAETVGMVSPHAEKTTLQVLHEP